MWSSGDPMPFSFLIVAGQIGVQLDVLRPAVYAVPVAAGLLSVLLFPAAALTLLHPGEEQPRDVLEKSR
jgi:hypothetical protein